MSHELTVQCKETPQLKRSRLASELRYLTQQCNSKIAELTANGLEVNLNIAGCPFYGDDAIIQDIRVSYQTPRKFY